MLYAVDLGPPGVRNCIVGRRDGPEFGARLTHTHVTPSVEIRGPGGRCVDQEVEGRSSALAYRTRKMRRAVLLIAIPRRVIEVRFSSS